MKTMILTLMAALSLPASAMSPIYVDPNLVVQLTVGGGMPVPGGLRFRTISLNRDGIVHVQESRHPEDFENGRPSSREYTLATVPPQDMLEIGKAVGQLKGGKLIRADRPPCMDAPAYNYAANLGGYLPSFYRVSNCIDEQLADKTQRAAAASLKTFLDQLDRMAR